MYDVYLQYGHNSPEYEALVQQKEEAESECVRRETDLMCVYSVFEAVHHLFNFFCFRNEVGGVTTR